MAIAHICHRCGTDLARIRAHREEAYGLTIVRCPGCRRVAVRRRHPLSAWWRTLRRIDWALTVLVVNALAAAVLLGGTIAGIAWFALEATDQPLRELWRRHDILLLFALILWPVLVGAWLTAGLGHWRRGAAWITFGVCAALGLSITCAAETLEDALHWGAAGEEGPRIDLARVGDGLDLWVRALALLYLFMVVALAGTQPGRGLAWLLRTSRRGLWRWRRRRAARAARGT